MRLALLLVLIAGLLAPSLGDVEAGKRRRHPRPPQRATTMVVNDGTSDTWNGVIAETVADFNAVMPTGGPTLIYQDVGPQVCPETMNVCSGALHPTIAGLARWTEGGEGGQVWLTDTTPLNPPGREAVACHEFMHILARVPDNYGARPNDSCVWGWATEPGAWDIATLLSRYGGQRVDTKGRACKSIDNDRKRAACKKRRNR